LHIDSGDTAWVLVSTALVMFMTPGLAFFYAGMVRARNALTMLMQNFFCLGLVSVFWAMVVYSIAFGGTNRWIGNFDFAWLGHFNTAPPGLALTIPPALYMSYQLMFAVITPALITGAIADRVRFGAWALFVGIWVVVVYAPVAHWVFAPAGWLARRGALDFAGGTVVHVNAGVAALAVVLVIGRRRGWPRSPMPPHSLPLTLVGTGILWFGWFGFNAGSALRANGLAVQALVNTHMAAAAAMLGWVIAERVHAGRPTILGAASGAVAGLVAITPCAGYVGGMSPIAIGAVTGVVCYFAVNIKFKLLFDDALDVVGVHLVGGVLGSLLLGLFADRSVNAAGRNGVFLHGGGFGLLGEQFLAVGVTLVYSFVVSFALAWVIDKVLPGGLRVDEESEDVGLDLREHSEVAYSFAER
jgi:ammonium transporter, Amt family